MFCLNAAVVDKPTMLVTTARGWQPNPPGTVPPLSTTLWAREMAVPIPFLEKIASFLAISTPGIGVYIPDFFPIYLRFFQPPVGIHVKIVI